MKLFHCHCNPDTTLFFDSVQCTVCSRLTGFCPDIGVLLAFDPGAEPGLWTPPDRPDRSYRQCDNYLNHQVCNWMVPTDDPEPLCRACRLTEVIPDLSVPENLNYWQQLEQAKRRTLYTILALGLPARSRHEADDGLLFRFMADRDPRSEFTEPLPDQEPVYTGHDDGEITINLAEADEVARTRTQRQLGEGYRTLLGHFRHEIGHYYWELLVRPDPERLQRFRELFGDERGDYGEAMKRHYDQGPPADWPQNFISAYATMHPWEDWAESWAHYLHMVDTLETAQSFRLQLHDTAVPQAPLPQQGVASDSTPLLGSWMQLAVAINALNRSMGLADAYPFVLTPAVQAKLDWIHRLIVDG